MSNVVITQCEHKSAPINIWHAKIDGVMFATIAGQTGAMSEYFNVSLIRSSRTKDFATLAEAKACVHLYATMPQRVAHLFEQTKHLPKPQRLGWSMNLLFEELIERGYSDEQILWFANSKHMDELIEARKPMPPSRQLIQLYMDKPWARVTPEAVASEMLAGDK